MPAAAVALDEARDDAPATGGSGTGSAACFILDDQQHIVEWNDAAASMLSIPARAAVGQPCYAVLQGLDPFGRPVCQPDCRAVEAIRSGQLAAHCTLALDRGAHAPRIRCDLHALPRGTGGAIVHLASRPAGAEPADAPSSQAVPSPAAGDLVRDLAALAALTTSLSPTTILPQLDDLLDMVRDATGVESAEIFLAEPAAGDLLLTAYRGPFRHAFGAKSRFSPGEGFPGIAAASGQPVFTADVGADPRYLRQLVQAKGYRAYVCVPLQSVDSPIGALCVGSRRTDVSPQSIARFLTWASMPIATALHAALLTEAATALPARIEVDGDDGDLDRLLQAVLRRMRLLANAGSGTLVMVSRQTGEVTGRVSDGVLDAPLCPCLDGHDPSSGCPVLEGGHGVALAGSRRAWPGACQHLHRQGSASYCLPLLIDGDATGIIQLTYQDRPPSPVSRHIAPLMHAATHAAAVLSIARGFAEQRVPGAAANAALRRQDAIRHFGEEQLARPAGESESGAGFLLHIRCFGSFEVRREGKLLSPETFKRRHALTVLKILLMHAGRPVARDTLIEALWPESDPDVALRRLHVVVHTLREVLEFAGARGHWEIIQSSHDGYAFAPSFPYWVDLAEFRAAIAAGSRAEEQGAACAAIDAYDTAVRVYRGDFCDDDRFAEWCWLEREQLRETYLDALQRLAALWLDRGEPERAIHRYRQVLRADPLRETAQHRLMECLCAAGRSAEALQHYDQFRQLLRQELDVAPSAQTEALVRRIRVGQAG